MVAGVRDVKIAAAIRGHSLRLEESGGAAVSGNRHVVRDHLHNLVLGLTLLRVHLVDCDPLVKQTIENLEEELQALRQAVIEDGPAAVLPPPDTPLVTQVPA